MGSEKFNKEKKKFDVMMTTHQDHDTVPRIVRMYETYPRARKNLLLVIVGNDADLHVLHLW